MNRFLRPPATQRGQASIEYAIVVMLVVGALVARPDVIVMVVDALRAVYLNFVNAISVSTLPF